MARRVKALAALRGRNAGGALVIALPRVSQAGVNRSLPAGHGVDPLFFMTPAGAVEIR